MDYNALMKLVLGLSYQLAIAGAETFRVEESITRVLDAYGVIGSAYSIPNCIIVTLKTEDGSPMTRMRRVEQHGTDLNSVELYSNLSRKICQEKPAPELALKWLRDIDKCKLTFRLPIQLLGYFLGSVGFCIFFGGGILDFICAGICGVLVGLSNYFLNKYHVNLFFSTIFGAFILSFAAYTMGALGICPATESVVIGAIMLLVPGLLFTNAMRDIIFGDTNSGINRIVHVLLIAVAIALGTGVAWKLGEILWSAAPLSHPQVYHPIIQCIGAFIGCVGFSIIFNIHGKGSILCSLGGVISWAVYCLAVSFGCSMLMCFFISSVIVACYAETMARIRKYPAISYLVVSSFPLLPGAGVYYTANYIVQGDMEMFANKGAETIAIAGIIAVGFLVVTTIVRFVTVVRIKKNV